jgi:hypothetical protein
MTSVSSRTPTRAAQTEADRQHIASAHRQLTVDSINNVDRQIILEAFLSQDKGVHITRKEAMLKLGMSSASSFDTLVKNYNRSASLKPDNLGRKTILSEKEEKLLRADIVDKTVSHGGFANVKKWKEYLMPYIKRSAMEQGKIQSMNVSEDKLVSDEKVAEMFREYLPEKIRKGDILRLASIDESPLAKFKLGIYLNAMQAERKKVIVQLVSLSEQLDLLTPQTKSGSSSSSSRSSSSSSSSSICNSKDHFAKFAFM